MIYIRLMFVPGHFPPQSPSLADGNAGVFKTDVVERAKKYMKGLGGGVGAYSNSQGVLAVREVW